jgi:hypothetical protein
MRHILWFPHGSMADSITLQHLSKYFISRSKSCTFSCNKISSSIALSVHLPSHLHYPNRYVAFLSGLAHITLPNAAEEVWVQGGKYGLIIAVDNAVVSEYGHITTYPSDADTVALQVPFSSGVIPNHMALHQGPCRWPEMAGI